MTRHLLVIGAQRCGTTYLHDLLDAHPDIAMARPARPEPKVFLSEESASRGLAWYRSTYFADAGAAELLGEKSTSYLEHPAAAARAAAMLGPALIVVQLRDPVARAVSNWRFSTAHGLEERTVEVALEDSLHGSRDWDRARTSVSPYAYLERGRYASYLAPWRTSFPETLQIRFLEDAMTGRTMPRDLYAAIGVDPDVEPPDQARPVNESTGTPPQLDAQLVRRLREYFRDSDARLAELVGRELPWPAAGVGGG